MGYLDDIQNALKSFKKSEKIYIHFYDYFRTTWVIWNDEQARTARSYPTRPDQIVTLFDGLKVETWNFTTIFIQFPNLCYQNLELISLIFWKLWAFPQGRNFVNFQPFFQHNFRLRWKFWILIVPSERSSWDLSEYTLFYVKKIIFHLSNSIFRWKMEFFRFFYAVFFK